MEQNTHEEKNSNGNIQDSVSVQQNFVSPNVYGKKQKKTRKISLGATVVIVLFAMLFTFQATYVSLTAKYKLELNKTKENVSELSVLLEALEMFKKDYVYDLNMDNLLNYMLASFAAEDRYSTYLSPEAYLNMILESQGNASGIGIYAAYSEKAIRVAHVMAGSPAEKAGLAYGDLIVSVGDKRVEDVGYNDAVDLIGQGSVVSLVVERNGEMLDISVTKGAYTPETVISSVIEENGEKIGYIRILQFDQVTVSQFKNAVKTLSEGGCEKLIFDLRGNPGGELTAIVEILDYLLPEGPIVHMLDADKNEIEVYKSDKNEVDMPMVVLTNGSTASAAELFTAALRDYEKAVLVGEKTYGKGCGQTYERLSNGGYISITTFFYNPPFGDNYDGIGIYPNIEVALPKEYENENLFFIPYESDTQLKAAVAYLTK